MIIRSKAPLRIGLAGGGTDVSPYSDMYGGAVLNVTINLFAHAAIELIDSDEVIFVAEDRNETEVYRCSSQFPLTGTLDLHKGVHNHLSNAGLLHKRGYRLTTFTDVPGGSGLGTSSTLVAAIIGAYRHLENLAFGDYEIARMAYEIERKDLGLAGGKQDQYAATFGGFNFMEFYSDDRVIVNPLRLRKEVEHEISHSLLLFYTGIQRSSAEIIKRQQRNVKSSKEVSINAMHKLKEHALAMKGALVRGEVNQLGELLHVGWRDKKKMTAGISNDFIDDLYGLAIANGATGGKISGAGGGGFMTFYCPNNTRHLVMKVLQDKGAVHHPYQIVSEGLISWET